MSNWCFIVLLGFLWLLPRTGSNQTSPSFGCQPGWYRQGNSCYFFSKLSRDKSHSWTNVMRECNLEDACLAIAHTSEKLQFLTSIAHSLKLDNVILGSRDTLNVSWKWSQGLPVNVDMWGHTSGVEPGNYKCGGLFSEPAWCGWWWIEMPCVVSDGQQYGYICETPIAFNSCRPGYLVEVANACYKLITSSPRKSWKEAQSSCNLQGGRLAVVDTHEKRIALSNELDKSKTKQAPVFIGLVRDMSSWSWTDGEVVNKSLFQVGRTIEIEDEEQCLALDASNTTNTGLVAINCSFTSNVNGSFVCEKQQVNRAEGGQVEYSNAENNAPVEYAVDGDPDTCLSFIAESNSWLKVKLDKKTYIYKVKINLSSSVSSLEVQVETSLPYNLTKACFYRISREKYILYECMLPAIQSSAVIIRPNSGGFNIDIREVQVLGLASSAEFHGVNQEVSQSQIQTQIKTQFQNRSSQRSRYKRQEDRYLFSAYLMVFENGDYYLRTYQRKFICTIKVTPALEKVFQNDQSESADHCLSKSRKTSTTLWKRCLCAKQHFTPIKLSVCSFYHVTANTNKKGVTIGLEYPDGKYIFPVPNKHVYWLQPGERSFRFQMLPNIIVVEVGKTFVLNASYRYCCHGIMCPNCSLDVDVRAFNSTLSTLSPILMDCKEYLWSTAKKATAGLGNYIIQISYDFLEDMDKDSSRLRRTVGNLTVKETTLLHCEFETEDICDWKRNGTGMGQWEKSTTGRFVATNSSLTALLETNHLAWDEAYQDACLSFLYKLNSSGADIEVHLSAKGNPSLLWKLGGIHGDVWNRAKVWWLPGESDSKLVFYGTGKAAIKDVLVTTLECHTEPPYADPRYECPDEKWQCKNKQSIYSTFLCDKNDTCADGSDETESQCKDECARSDFQCPSGSCLSADKLCNEDEDCVNGTDENTCERRNEISNFQCVNGTFVPWSQTCQEGSQACGDDDTHLPDICSRSACPLNNISCNESNKCYTAFSALCSFEDDMCGLMNDSKDPSARWVRRTSTTSSLNTGPNFDHSTLSKSGSYLYIEGAKGTKARLYSRWFTENKPVCFHFWYYMSGTRVGVLNITEITNSTTSIKWSQTGDKEKSWLFGQVTLLSGDYQPYMFVIEGVRGDGDIAIDDLGIYKGACAKILKQSSPNCGFESDRCGWQGVKEWDYAGGRIPVKIDDCPCKNIDDEPMTYEKGEFVSCEDDCPTEELRWWKSRDTAMNWSVVSALHFIQRDQEEEEVQLKVPLSADHSNIATNLVIEEQMEAVTLCFWMRSQTRGPRVLYKIPYGCKIIVGIGLYFDANVTISVLGRKWVIKKELNNGHWHHVCLTWRSADDMLNGYIDGHLVLETKVDGFDSVFGAENGTLIASIVNTTAKNDPDVKRTICGLNLWSCEMKQFRSMAKFYDCKYEEGSILSWKSISKPFKKNRSSKEAEESISKEEQFILAANSSRHRSAVLESPWYKRPEFFTQTQCLGFHYIFQGSGAIRLRVMHRTDPNNSFVPVMDIYNNNESRWKNARTPVGSVVNYQLSLEASFNHSEGIIAIRVLEIFDDTEYCSKDPIQNQTFKVILTNRSGIITSPFYPGNYYHDATYIWLISAPENSIIRLEILAFDLENHTQCEKDYLELFDGGSVTSNRSGRFCGHVYRPITESTTNKLTVRFRSDSSVNKTGFKFSYTWKNVSRKEQECAAKKCKHGIKCSVTSTTDESEKSHFVVESHHRSLKVMPAIPQQATILLLAGNHITNLTTSHLDNLPLLEYIDLSGNLIFNTNNLAFTNISSLNVIRLNGNFIKSIPKFAFLPILKTLDLGANLLSNVTNYYLASLPRLRTLSLRKNEIARLQDELFVGMPRLHYLYLDNNKIETLTKNTFKGLGLLCTLNLQNNKILEKNVKEDVFENLINLKYLKLDNFILCCYAKKSLSKDLICESAENEFSSCDDMMKNSAVRICLWILGIVASVGNLLVVIWRSKVRDNDKVQSLLLTNLAVADFLMGIYLLILAVKDTEYKGKYYKHDVDWRSGLACQLTGALAMLSSEASVLTLTLITADRLISVVFAFKIPRLSLEMTSFLCIIIWAFCLVISFLPTLGLDYFDGDNGLYGQSAVCLPIQLSSERTTGWEYSITFFIFLNLTAFVFIMVSYCAILWTIVRMSRSSAGTKHMPIESSKAARLFFIIFTDLCCWVPVIILGILSFAKAFNDPHGTVHVWIAVFVLPLNSSVNPILYTFSTAYVKRQITSWKIFPLFSRNSHTKESHIRDRSRTGDDISLKEMYAADHPHLPKVVVTCLENDLVKELTILKEWNTFELEPVGVTVGFVSAETKSKEKVLIKYFGEKHLEDWKREVAVQTVLMECGGHDNVMTSKWNADAESSSLLQLNNASSIPRKVWLLCFPLTSSKNLKDYCENQRGPGVLYNVLFDVISGLEFLHGNGICHNYINNRSILVEDKTRIPRYKAVIGDFRYSLILHDKSESDSCKHKLKDVEQLGVLIDILLKMREEDSPNEIRDLSTILTSDKNSAEILASWKETLLHWHLSSAC